MGGRSTKVLLRTMQQILEVSSYFEETGAVGITVIIWSRHLQEKSLIFLTIGM